MSAVFLGVSVCVCTCSYECVHLCVKQGFSSAVFQVVRRVSVCAHMSVCIRV